MSVRKYEVTLISNSKKRIIKVREDETILNAALQEGIDLPYTCLQGWCITCSGKILDGEVDQSMALRYFPEDKKHSFVLLCTALPRSDLIIKTHQKEEMKKMRVAHKLPVPQG